MLEQVRGNSHNGLTFGDSNMFVAVLKATSSSLFHLQCMDLPNNQYKGCNTIGNLEGISHSNLLTQGMPLTVKHFWLVVHW